VQNMVKEKRLIWTDPRG